MEKESRPKPTLRPNFQNIIIGILIGSLITMAGMLIYMNYLDQITRFLLYISLILFGVVIATFILVWGFKTYLTRLIFGSKVADSPDLIAEAQQMTDQLSSNVIDKLLEKATEEDKEKVKGLVVRLGNWFLWGRLRNWWWSWILGIFVSLGGLTGTLLLVNQNELLQNQNQLIKNQMSLEEASRRGALVMLMSNIFDKVDREIERQRDTMRAVTDSTKFSLSQSLIGQIAALSQAFKPYRYMDGEELIEKPLSPERGQLLVTITRLPLDTGTVRKLYEQSTFNFADLRGALLNGSDLRRTRLRWADLSGGKLSNANLYRAKLSDAKLVEVDMSRCNLVEANLVNAKLARAIFEDANLSNADLSGADFFMTWLGKADLSEAILIGADLSEPMTLRQDQIIKVRSLHNSKLPPWFDAEKLKKEYPKLFDYPRELLW